MIQKPVETKTEPTNEKPVETKPLKTIEVPVEEKVEENQTVEVDFQDESIAEKFFEKKTKTSSDSPGIDPNKPIEEIQDEIRDYEASRSGKLEYKDYLQISEFLINLIDTGVSTFLNWFAKDTAPGAYSITAPNKRLLKEQLALILVKYQSKFSIEWTFILGLIIIYSAPTMAAVKNRRERLAKGQKADMERFKGEKTKVERRSNPEPPDESAVESKPENPVTNPDSSSNDLPKEEKKKRYKPGRKIKYAAGNYVQQ